MPKESQKAGEGHDQTYLAKSTPFEHDISTTGKYYVSMGSPGQSELSRYSLIQ